MTDNKSSQKSHNIRNAPSNARQVAVQTLFAVAENNAWSDGALRRSLSEAKLSARDAAFATRLVYGTIQNTLLCDWYVRQFSHLRLKKIQPRILICLRMALYELLLMDGVPSRATVYETVSLIRSCCHANERTVSFVNAVLRSAAQAIESDTLPRLDCPDKESYYSLRYSHPEWLVRRLSSQYGRKLTEQILQSNNRIAPTSVRVNLLRATPEQMIDELTASGVSVRQHEKISTILECTGGNIADLPAFQDGKITIQDAAGVVVAAAAAPSPGMFILDCCAAPGGKSLVVAEQIQSAGRVVACDIYPHKIQRIREGAARLGLSCIEAVIADATVFHQEWAEIADIVLCDVPCSGMGVIRKKPEIRYRKQEDIETLSALQMKILENCARYVRPGGALLYSTCTIFQEENADIVHAFLSAHSDFIAEQWEHPICGKQENGMVTLLPPLHHTDGFFIAKLRKQGTATI